MKLKKLTVEVPEDVLKKAISATGQGITPTVRESAAVEGEN